MTLRLSCLLVVALGALHAQTGFRIVLTGDSIINRRLSVIKDPGYLAMFEPMRRADAAFTNFETLVHNFEYPGAAVSGGSYMASPAFVIDELKWAGFNLFAVANNHTFDFGVEGMRSTLRALTAAGVAHAGAGENLAFARAPAFLDTSAGRVALVSCASTFTEGSYAGTQRPDLKGRPGLSPLRFSTIYGVDESTMQGLRVLARVATPNAATTTGPLRLGGATYEIAAKIGVRTEPSKIDLDGITASVRESRRQADWVVVSIHAHEGKPESREIPADFLVTFAHAAIDAGADVFVGHGPHVLRGIEIYKGKPIFYSLANFIFENETMPFQPNESYQAQDLPLTASVADFYDARSKNDTRGFPPDRPIWESVVAEVVFNSDRKLEEIVLRPITLGFGEPRSRRGIPRPASGELGREILKRAAKLSAPFGTIVEISGDRGIVNAKR